MKREEENKERKSIFNGNKNYMREYKKRSQKSLTVCEKLPPTSDTY
jgi:hypothetical protein